MYLGSVFDWGLNFLDLGYASIRLVLVCCFCFGFELFQKKSALAYVIEGLGYISFYLVFVLPMKVSTLLFFKIFVFFAEQY